MKRLILIISALLISSFAFSQTPEGYEIKVHLKNFPKDSTAYLGYYFGYNQTVIQTKAKADANGNFVFKGNKSLPEGLYTVSKHKNIPMFDVLIQEQNFSVESDTNQLVKNLKIVGSKENELYYTHQQEVLAKYEDYKFAKMQFDAKKDMLSKARLNRVQQEIVALQRQFVKDNEGTLASKIVNAALEPEIPAAPLLPNGKRDSAYVFTTYKNNFLKMLDWSDNRMARTPYVHRRLERYFNDLVIQQNDTLIKEIDKVLALTQNATEVRKFIIYRLASTYETPKYLNIDGVFIHLVKQYYVNEPSLWDSATVKKMSDRVKVLEPLMTGKKMPNMLLTNQLGQAKPLYGIANKYMIVFAYDPDCAHCKEAMPVLLKAQPALQKRGATIYAVSVSHNMDKWKTFIKQFKTESLTNVADASHGIDYRNDFDIQNTPTIYVLDANKNIIGKRIVVDQLENFLAYYERTIGNKQ